MGVRGDVLLNAGASNGKISFSAPGVGFGLFAAIHKGFKGKSSPGLLYPLLLRKILTLLLYSWVLTKLTRILLV